MGERAGDWEVRKRGRVERNVETEKIHRWMNWAIQVVGTPRNNPLELLAYLLNEIPQRKNGTGGQILTF